MRITQALTIIKGKTSTYEEIITAALTLPPGAKAMLVDRLLESLDSEDQRRVDSLWAEEAGRRVKEIEDGVVTPVPGEEVMNRLRARNKECTILFILTPRKSSKRSRITTTTMAQNMSAEPTYLEKVESYLVDQFHHGLHRIMLETLWSDMRVGAWSDDLKFFNYLDAEYEYLLANSTKPLQVEIHLRNLNFSGQETVSGLGNRFFESQLACNRQKILLLHSLRLMLENRNPQRTDLSLLIPAIRREIHQVFD